MPPWASMESHSSTLPFESMTTSVLVGRLSAAYSPATPQPAITTSPAHILVCLLGHAAHLLTCAR